MADERNRRQIQFFQFEDEGVVNCPAIGTWLYHLHDLVFAIDEQLPDFFSHWRGIFDDGGAADASLIATLYSKDFDTADVSGLQFPFAWADVGQLAALSGCDDQQLELLGRQARKPRRVRTDAKSVSLSPAFTALSASAIAVSAMRDNSRRSVISFWVLICRKSGKDCLVRLETRVRHSCFQPQEVTDRQIIHFDAIPRSL